MVIIGIVNTSSADINSSKRILESSSNSSNSKKEEDKKKEERELIDRLSNPEHQVIEPIITDINFDISSPIIRKEEKEEIIDIEEQNIGEEEGEGEMELEWKGNIIPGEINIILEGETEETNPITHDTNDITNDIIDISDVELIVEDEIEGEREEWMSDNPRIEGVGEWEGEKIVSSVVDRSVNRDEIDIDIDTDSDTTDDVENGVGEVERENIENGRERKEEEPKIRTESESATIEENKDIESSDIPTPPTAPPLSEDSQLIHVLPTSDPSISLPQEYDEGEGEVEGEIEGLHLLTEEERVSQCTNMNRKMHMLEGHFHYDDHIYPRVFLFIYIFIRKGVHSLGKLEIMALLYLKYILYIYIYIDKMQFNTL